MPDLYKKMYTYLVKEVDDTLKMAGKRFFQEGYAKDRLLTDTMDKLKNALLTAEEMYLDAEEEELQGK